MLDGFLQSASPTGAGYRQGLRLQENGFVRECHGKVRADEAGIGSPIGSFKASDDEYERFCVKYGVELVEMVYGKKGSKALEKAMGETKAKPSAKGKPAAV